jgi:ribonuclease-3 family protein
MEESLNPTLDYLKKQFKLEEVDVKTYSPLTLAYIGDGVYELIIRTVLVKRGNCQANKLHKRASQLVKAKAQSDIIHEIMEELSEEELAVYKRGRNAKSATMAKNATMSDYRRATGFEALIGYLYLREEMIRAIDLIKIGLEKIGE